MRTQVYNIVSGVETASPPAGSDPSADADLVNLGFANKSYARGLATVAAVKALASTARTDNLPIFCDELNTWFYFDSASSKTGNDITVLTPDAGTGRWLRLFKPTEQTLTDASGPSNVTGAVFDKTKIQSTTLKYTIKRSDTTRASSGLLELVTDGTNWEIVDLPAAALPSGSDVGVVFTITSAGQVQYTADAGSATKLSWKIMDITEVAA